MIVNEISFSSKVSKNLFQSVNLHHIIRIGTVSQNILSSKQHLQLRILEAVSEFAESLPWIFLQEAEGCVERSPAPALYRMISYLIHLLNDRQSAGAGLRSTHPSAS